MHFVTRGVLEVYPDSIDAVASAELGAGDYFGEVRAWMEPHAP